MGGGWWWGPVVGPRRGTSRTLRWASSLGSTEAKVAKVALLRDRAPPGKRTGAQRGTATGNGPMATKCSGSGPPMEPPCLRWERPWTVSSRSSCLILFLSGPSLLYRPSYNAPPANRVPSLLRISWSWKSVLRQLFLSIGLHCAPDHRMRYSLLEVTVSR